MSESGTNVRSSLSARVAQFVKSQPTSRRSGRARAAVIAQRDEIARAIADGWAVKTIWQTLQADGSVTVGYHAFRRQVAELLTPSATANAVATVSSAPPRLASPRARDDSRFVHNAAPQKDEIYGP